MQRTWQLALLVCLFALGSRWFGGVRADEQPQSAKDGPTRVALVDSVRLLTNYPRFNELQEELKKRIKDENDKLNQRAEELKPLAAEAQSYPASSPERKKLELEIRKALTEIQAERFKLNAELTKQNAEICNTCYRTVQAEVVRYAESKGIQIVLRYTESETKESDNLETVMQRVQTQVIYHAGLDITDEVLANLR
jgi:Skp family chaperone for outer membrane proteins